MGAGGYREPRKIKRNPGRGSQRLRRALGGTRILLAAAPTASPCFCRWQRSSLLHRGFFARRTIRRALRVALAAFSAALWQGFEKAERCPQPRLPVSAAGGGRLRCCSNPPLRVKLEIPDKTKNQRIFYAGLFGGRGWISRAALLKTAQWAVFAPSSATSPQLFESTRPVSLAL